MFLKDTKINQGGLMRCCLATIDNLDQSVDYPDHTVIDCKYEKMENKNIVLIDGVWRWNRIEFSSTSLN